MSNQDHLVLQGRTKKQLSVKICGPKILIGDKPEMRFVSIAMSPKNTYIHSPESSG